MLSFMICHGIIKFGNPMDQQEGSSRCRRIKRMRLDLTRLTGCMHRPMILALPLRSKRGRLPVVACGLKDASYFTVFDLSGKLRERGWVMPASTPAPNAQDIAMSRIVVREGSSRGMADFLLTGLKNVVFFEDRSKPKSEDEKTKTRGVC